MIDYLEINFEDFLIEDFKHLLNKHGLIIIRGKDLTISEFENFTLNLGKPLVTTKHVLNENRTVQELSNQGLFGNSDVDWHNDWSYGRGNYFGTVLYNVKNAELSPTKFTDMSKVPNYLFEKYKNCSGKYYPPSEFNNCFTEKQLTLLKKQEITRPFVFTHPNTLEKILYCSPGTIQENTIDLSEIISYAERNCYSHIWEKNDILIWDNLKMMHKRGSFTGERLLWRTQFII